MGYHSKPHVELKYYEIPFDHGLCLSYQIILKFSSQHGSNNTMHCAQLQKDFKIWMDPMEERDFAKFELMMSFVGTVYTAHTEPNWLK